MKDGYSNGTATTYPEPKDMEAFIKKQLYDYEYDNCLAIAPRYTWNI